MPPASPIPALIRQRPPLLQYFSLALLILLLAALMLYPLLATAGAAFTDHGSFTTLWFRSALTNPTFQHQLVNSLLLAATFTASLRPFRGTSAARELSSGLAGAVYPRPWLIQKRKAAYAQPALLFSPTAVPSAPIPSRAGGARGCLGPSRLFLTST